jgi:hypothetical protein
MTPADHPDPQPPEVENPTAADQAHGSVNATTPRVKSAEARMLAGEVLQRWGYVVERSSWRPHVAVADPAAPGECLCGEPADFVVETNWFGGRHSQDPVCRHHLEEVVSAIRKEQARRNGV